MKIRQATKQDLAAIVDMGAKFHAASPIHQAIPFDTTSFYRFCDVSLDNPDIGFWVVDQEGVLVGMTAAIVYPAYFNAHRHIAQELFWWVDEAARGAGAGKALIEELKPGRRASAQTLCLCCHLLTKTRKRCTIYTPAGAIVRLSGRL